MLLMPIPPGEFLDRLTIVEIKSERISDPMKLENVRRELGLLREAWSTSTLSAHDVGQLVARLKQINEALWEIEDRIRDKEAAASFDAEFVELARSVYRTNDQRAAIKREINVVLGSDLTDEKSYRPY